MELPRLFAPLPPEARRLMDGIPALIDKVFPAPGRFRSALPADVAELSRLLTSGRGERGLSYLGRPPMLSAYLRYFLPWNLYRLCRLLPGLDIRLAANDHVTDLGCGPLTFAAALWMSRPDLRAIPLEFHCIDRSGPALDAGKKFFAVLAGGGPWKMHTVKGGIDTAKMKPAALVCAVNVFNEMFGDFSRCNADAMKRNAEKSARLLASYAAASSSVLVVEPGFPRCGEFISLLRSEFIGRGRQPLSPCPHNDACPFPAGISKAGAKKRWCHFSFETDDAPAALRKLSTAAGIPKERAVLSFLLAGPANPNADPPTPVLRVISDAFPLPQNRFGRYCCSRQGLVLLGRKKDIIERTASGSLVNAIFTKGGIDPKSGALEAEFSMSNNHESQGNRIIDL